MSVDRLLDLLRETASETKPGNWSKWDNLRSITGQLFAYLYTQQIISLGVEQVVQTLPLFIEQHPDERWVYLRIDQIKLANAIETEQMLTAELPEKDNSYPSRESNNFLSALIALWNATANHQNPEKCISFTVDAIAEAILSRLVLTYRRKNIEATGKENASHFMSSVEFKEMEKDAWYLLADDIEEYVFANKDNN